MDQRLIGESEESRNYIEYPEVEIIVSNCCGCPCCCKVAYFPIQKLTFIGHWRKSLPTPILVGFFYLITIVSYFWDTYDTFPNITDLIISYVFTSFTFFCFIFGYFSIIIKGPGYAPYSWINTHQHSYTWAETMKNIAIYNNQLKFALSSSNIPKRSCFSKDARRFVLRADHFCQLGKSWIGLKNYRYYLLTCFYCFLFSISIMLSRTWLYIGIFRYYKTEKNISTYGYNLSYNYYHQNNIITNKHNHILNNPTKKIQLLNKKYKNDNSFDSKNRNNINKPTGNNICCNFKYNKTLKNDNGKRFKFRIWYAFGISTTLIACFFGISSLFNFLCNFHNLYKNVTTFELATKNHVGEWDRGCIRNFEEVCGPRKYLIFWPFPFVCLDPMESGFYDEIWDQNSNNFDAGSQESKYQTMDSLY